MRSQNRAHACKSQEGASTWGQVHLLGRALLAALRLQRGCESPRSEGQNWVPGGAGTRRTQMQVGPCLSSVCALSSRCAIFRLGVLFCLVAPDTGRHVPAGVGSEMNPLWACQPPGASGLGTVLQVCPRHRGTACPTPSQFEQPSGCLHHSKPPRGCSGPPPPTYHTTEMETVPELLEAPVSSPNQQPGRCPGWCWRAAGSTWGTAGWACFRGKAAAQMTMGMPS